MIGSSKETAAHLRAENEELRRRLEEADQTLDAIRSGEVDALIVSGAEGEQVFTLKGADYAYRSLVENMSEGAATLDAGGIILYCNKRLADMLQLPLEQMVTSPFRPLVSPPDYREFDALFKRAGHQVSKGEVNLVTASGSSIPVNLSLNILKLEETPVTVVIATDLTQQKVIGQMVATEQLSISITKQANEAILVCDENGQVIRASAVASNLCGADPLFKQFEDMFRISVTDSNSDISRGTGAESPLRFNDLLKGGGISRRECTLTCADNRKHSLLISAGPLRDTNSRTIGCVIILTDITNFKQAVAELMESEEQIRASLENAPDGIYMNDLEGNFLYGNRRCEEIIGYKREELIGKNFLELNILSESSLARAVEVLQDNIKGKSTGPDEVELISRDGHRIPLEINTSIVQRKGRAVVLSFVRDITERKLSEEKLLKSYESMKKTLNDALNTMVKIVEIRDPYTAGHQQKVAQLATAIAGEMKLEDTRIDQLRTSAVVHDIGKMYIPSDILSKPGKITDIEFNLIKTHVQSGYDIVNGMDFPGVIAQAILQHHERLDGSGYPNGLKGEDTLLEAKILAVADVIEAMSSHRPYRSALGIDKALEEISKNRGKLYDAGVVDTCLELFKGGKFEFKAV